MSGDFMQITRNEHLPSRISAQFSEHIQHGSLKPGDKLPTEHEMAKNFGVSRSVIREAIAQLRNEGLVETKQGVGAFVIERTLRHIRLNDAEQMERHEFRDLFQLRVALEIEAAGLAAMNHSAVHLEQLNDASIRMAKPEDWANNSVAADLEFHRIIAEATGNPYFTKFIGAISDRISHVILEARAKIQLEEIIGLTLNEHGELRDAIAANDPISARAAMRRHLIGSAERVGLKLELYA